MISACIEASSSASSMTMVAPHASTEQRRTRRRSVVSLADDDSCPAQATHTPSRRRGASRGASIVTLAALAGLALLASLLPTASAQRLRQQADDPVTLEGTWATGSAQTQTGLSFYNPINQTFNVPRVGGQSYSFTRDGFWEQSIFTFQADPTQPNCAQAQLIWQHGNYTMNQNGSLTLYPFLGDGRQLIQNQCNQVSSQILYYDQQEYMMGFYIRRDWHYGSGAYYLQLFEFDGTPKPWMWQIYNPPNMLPTQQLKQRVYGQVNSDSALKKR